MKITGMMDEQYDSAVGGVRQGRHVLLILPELYDDEEGYRAVAAVEGLQGLLQTRLYCGHDYEMAVWYVNQKNLAMGVDAKAAAAIIRTALVDTPFQAESNLCI